MASLKEIRTRKASVASTRQITSAMKMVAAAKLRKAQDAITQLRPYAELLQDILVSLGGSLRDDNHNPYLRDDEHPEKILLVLITSNRGLCGAFNSNAIKTTIQRALTTYPNQMLVHNLYFAAIGRKGSDFLRKKGYNLVYSNEEIFDDLTFENAMTIADKLMTQFVKGDYDRIDLIYNQFKNAGTQVMQEEQFLPIKVPDPDESGEPSVASVDYIFEPSKEYIVEELIPRSLKLQFYKALLDSNASEHGARMTAMHKATDNATELIKELNLEYNKARQASITNEILEITSGAEALKG